MEITCERAPRYLRQSCKEKPVKQANSESLQVLF